MVSGGLMLKSELPTGVWILALPSLAVGILGESLSPSLPLPLIWELGYSLHGIVRVK